MLILSAALCDYFSWSKHTDFIWRNFCCSRSFQNIQCSLLLVLDCLRDIKYVNTGINLRNMLMDKKEVCDNMKYIKNIIIFMHMQDKTAIVFGHNFMFEDLSPQC